MTERDQRIQSPVQGVLAADERITNTRCVLRRPSMIAQIIRVRVCFWPRFFRTEPSRVVAGAAT